METLQELRAKQRSWWWSVLSGQKYKIPVCSTDYKCRLVCICHWYSYL